MGDINIALDLIDGVQDIAAEVGDTVIIRSVSKTDLIDPASPSKGRTTVNIDREVESVLTDFRENQIDGTKVQAGDKQAIIDIKSLDFEIDTSDIYIDGTDPDNSTHYNIEDIQNIRVSGLLVTQILQLRK